MSDTRTRLTKVALELFARNGYRNTSVSEIQLAAGLTGGSGALYKHFRSKEELLATIVEDYVRQLTASGRQTISSLPSSAPEALGLIARGVVAAMTSDSAILRLLLRDLDDFPELRDQLWDGVLRNVYAEFAEWLRAESREDSVARKDPQEASAVLMASLTYAPILRALIDHDPGDVELDRFVSTWTDVACLVLGVDPSAA